MRQPFQVLVIPFRHTSAGFEFAVLKRSDENYWQFVAGGGENSETIIEAARRETQEEIGITGKLLKLDSVSAIPKNCFAGSELWDKNIDKIPEHCFAIDVTNSKITLSSEHTHIQWLSYGKACALLKWNSNRKALQELNTKLKKDQC